MLDSTHQRAVCTAVGLSAQSTNRSSILKQVTLHIHTRMQVGVLPTLQAPYNTMNILQINVCGSFRVKLQSAEGGS